MSTTSERAFAEFADRLGYSFRSAQLLEQALTHRSAVDGLDAEHNERLEFLGDAVLELVSSEWLYSRWPSEREGTLTQRRSRLVSADALARVAAHLGVPNALRLSSGEELSGGRKKPSLLANAVEALLGSIYLDGGLEAARDWLVPLLEYLEASMQGDAATIADPKNRLQELLQADGRALPEYRTVRVDGPSHRPTFEVECRVEGRVLGRGSGSSKQRAQRSAADQALEQLEVL